MTPEAAPVPGGRLASTPVMAAPPRPQHVVPWSLARVPEALAPGAGTVEFAGRDAAARGGATGVTGVTHDSRAVRPGDLYAALPGSHTHGARFSAAAAAAGAAAVLTDAAGREDAVASGLPVVVVPVARRALGPDTFDFIPN